MKRDFTLVELMVVVVIIAILAGILLPTLTGGREKATSAKCIGNLKQLGAAMVLYSSDNDNYLITDIELPSYDSDHSDSWAGLLLDYAKEVKIYNCDADENEDKVNIGKNCLVSYYANGKIHRVARQKLYNVERASGTVSLGPRPKNIDKTDHEHQLGNDKPPKSELERHGKTSNYLFLDGHTESIQKKTFQQDWKEKGTSTKINGYWNDGKGEIEKY